MPRESSPAFSFYPDDWLSSSSVSTMTAEARGCYIMLLCHLWRDGALPDDDEILAALARVPIARWKAVRDKVLRPCRLTDAGWINDRLEQERAGQQERRRQQSRNGKAGATKRWKHGEAIARPSRGHSEAIVSPMAPPMANDSFPSPSSYVPPNPQGGEASEDHPAGWLCRSYPRWYAEERSGATYRVQPTLDWQAALGLTETWPDRKHLERMCRTFLRASNLPAAHANRSLVTFARQYASACDAQVRAGGAA